MKELTREEFLIYCLLYAEEVDFNFTKRDLIAMVTDVKPEDFMKVYNRFVMESESERLEVIGQHKMLYINDMSDKMLFFEELKKKFFYEERFVSIGDNVIKILDAVFK